VSEGLPIGKRVKILRTNGTQVTGLVQREAEPGTFIIQVDLKPNADVGGPPPQPFRRVHVSEIGSFEELPEAGQ
jgi:hypothetical protein